MDQDQKLFEPITTNKKKTEKKVSTHIEIWLKNIFIYIGGIFLNVVVWK